MAQQLPPGLLLTAEDACVLDGLLRRAVYETARRDGHAPRRIVELSELIHRTALEFRAAVLVNAGSGTGEDESSSVTAISDTSDERLTARQAARLAGVSPEFIRRMACEGVLQGAKSGHRGAWRLDPSSVAVWMASRKTAA